MNKDLSKAVRIGTICIVTYIASYVTRNILSVSTPEMITGSFFTKEYIGLLSSLQFIFYAAGQLVNGFIGERVHPKLMISIGLAATSISTLFIPATEIRLLHFICFAMIGFALSMLRGPMMKIISENTTDRYARILCTLFCVVGFAGPLIASLLSIVFKWKTVFFITGIFTALMSCFSYVFIGILERKKEISFSPVKENGLKSIFGLFKMEKFVAFMLLNAIAEIAGTSITFWVPTYSTEFLGFSSETSAVIYSIISFSTLFAPFIALFLYEKISKNEMLISLVLFSLSAFMFLLMEFIQIPIINIALLLLAKISVGSAAGIVWSVYIPSLGKSGNVSSANGVIDAFAYATAAAASALFSILIAKIGWNGLILIWCFIMVAGVTIPTVSIINKRKA